MSVQFLSLPLGGTETYPTFASWLKPSASAKTSQVRPLQQNFLPAGYYTPVGALRFGKLAGNNESRAERALTKVNEEKTRFLESYSVPEEYKAFVPDFEFPAEALTKFNTTSGAGYYPFLHRLTISKAVLLAGGVEKMPLQEIIPHEVYHAITGIARAHLQLRAPDEAEKALQEGFSEKIKQGSIVGTMIVGADTSDVPDDVKPKLNIKRSELNQITRWSNAFADELYQTPGYFNDEMTCISEKGLDFMESKVTDNIKSLLGKRTKPGSTRDSLKELTNFGLYMQHNMRMIKIPSPSIPPALREKLADLFDTLIRNRAAYINEDVWGSDTLNDDAKRSIEKLLKQPESKAFVDTFDSSDQALDRVTQYLNAFVGWKNRVDIELMNPVSQALQPLKDIPLTDETRKLAYALTKDKLADLEAIFYQTFDSGNAASHMIYSVLSPEERNARKVSYEYVLSTITEKLACLKDASSTPVSVEEVKRLKKEKAQYETNLKVIGLYETMIEKNEAAQKLWLRFPAYDKASRQFEDANFKLTELQGSIQNAIHKLLTHEQIFDISEENNPLKDLDIETLPGMENVSQRIAAVTKKAEELTKKLEVMTDRLKDYYTQEELNTRMAPTNLFMEAHTLLPHCTPSLQMDLGYSDEEEASEADEMNDEGTSSVVESQNEKMTQAPAA